MPAPAGCRGARFPRRSGVPKRTIAARVAKHLNPRPPPAEIAMPDAEPLTNFKYYI